MSLHHRIIFPAAVMVLIPGLMAATGGGSLFIDNRAYYTSRERGPVNFPHEKHMERGIDCTRCHHDYQQGRNRLDLNKLVEGSRTVRCVYCHGKYGRAGKRFNLQRAYHGQCMGCHRTKILRREGRPPLLCGECHITHGKGK